MIPLSYGRTYKSRLCLLSVYANVAAGLCKQMFVRGKQQKKKKRQIKKRKKRKETVTERISQEMGISATVQSLRSVQRLHNVTFASSPSFLLLSKCLHRCDKRCVHSLRGGERLCFLVDDGGSTITVEYDRSKSIVVILLFS